MPLTRDQAVQLAFAEFHKRGISVSPRWQIKTFEDVHMPELHPEVPLYVVEFYDPSLSLKYPLYIIKFHRYTWELDGFDKIDVPGSLHTQRGHRSNQTMQPTASRLNVHFL